MANDHGDGLAPAYDEHKRRQRSATRYLFAAVGCVVLALVWEPRTWGPSYVGGVNIGPPFGYGVLYGSYLGIVLFPALAYWRHTQMKKLRERVAEQTPSQQSDD